MLTTHVSTGLRGCSCESMCKDVCVCVCVCLCVRDCPAATRWAALGARFVTRKRVTCDAKACDMCVTCHALSRGRCAASTRTSTPKPRKPTALAFLRTCERWQRRRRWQTWRRCWSARLRSRVPCTSCRASWPTLARRASASTPIQVCFLNPAQPLNQCTHTDKSA